MHTRLISWRQRCSTPSPATNLYQSKGFDMAENEIEKFERLKKRAADLQVKRLAAEAEVKRLSDELEKCKADIKSAYNVEIEDFAKAIETMKSERDRKMGELEKMISDAEEKLEVRR